MNRWTPCKRKDFVNKLRQIGFDGPFSGSKHQFMIYKFHRLTIPSNSEYSVPQFRMLIREVEDIINRAITINEWYN